MDNYEIYTTTVAAHKIEENNQNIQTRKTVPYGGRYWPSLYTFFCQLAILSALMAVIFGGLAISLMSYLWLVDYTISHG